MVPGVAVEEFALAESGAEREFKEGVQAVALRGSEKVAGLVDSGRVEAARLGRPGADVAGDVARDLLLTDGMLQGRLEPGVDVGQRQWREVLAAALADGAASRLAAGRGVGLAAGVDAACAALADGPQPVQPAPDVFDGQLASFFLPRPGMKYWLTQAV
nr:hypothetical protein KitaXyl93_50900 [Kitasatospora sp. Xyl93]